MRKICIAVATAFLAACAPGVQAAIVPSVTVAGPDPNIVSLGGVALAEDSTGAIVFLETAGGSNHVFVSLLAQGTWGAPVQVDPGLGAASQPQVAVTDKGRVAVVWISDGELYGAVHGVGAHAFSAPQAIAPALSNPSLSMGISGTAYVSWTVADGGGTDVDVARLDLFSTSFVPLDGALNSSPSVGAGVGVLRSQVSVAADAIGIVTWGEMGADGRTHVLLRRVYGLNESAATIDATVNELAGAMGYSADSPVVGMQDDSDYPWVAFRQSFDNGNSTQASRVVTEEIIGTQVQPPQTVDSLSFPAAEAAGAPAIAIDGNGDGLIATPLSPGNEIVGASTTPSGWTAGETLDPFADTLTPVPVVALGRDEQGVVGWEPGTGSVQAQLYDDGTPGQLAQMSINGFGPIDPDGLSAAQDDHGDSLVAFVQGSPARIAVGASVPKPGVVRLLTASKAQQQPVVLQWSPSVDTWSAITYEVMLDNVMLKTTAATHLRLQTTLTPGLHHWQVIAIDGFGQQRPSSLGVLAIKKR